RIRSGRVDLVDHRHFCFGQVLVPAQLFEHAEREFRIPVLDLRILGIGSIGKQAHLDARAVSLLLLTLDAKAGAETTAALHPRKIGVVEERSARMLDFGRTPAGPWQAVI